MLAAQARMRASDEFRRTVRQGVRVARPTLVLHARPQPSPPDQADTGSTQVGFVVSKAVGGAVVRNRVKRRLRHLSRPLIDAHPGLRVVVAGPSCVGGGLVDVLGRDLVGAWQAGLRRLTPADQPTDPTGDRA